MDNIFTEQLQIHINNVEYALQTCDYSKFKLFNIEENKFVKSSTMFRKLNDILAATFCEMLTIDSLTGYDAFDMNGDIFELKLAFVSANNYHIHPKSNRLYTNGNTVFESSICAKYEVYSDYNIESHNKNTYFVLISEDHAKFIDGFMLSGDKIVSAMSKQNTFSRKISIRKFLSGTKVQTAVPHIGYYKYVELLTKYRSNIISKEDFLGLKI